LSSSILKSGWLKAEGEDREESVNGDEDVFMGRERTGGDRLGRQVVMAE
jgi:hypothetical protein